jgi:Protein of unknown function (DUF4246)
MCSDHILNNKLLFFIMSEIITQITAKPNWRSKIVDNNISSKWIRELCEAGFDHNYVFNVIEILKKYADYIDNTNQKYDDELEVYDWFLKTNFDVSEIVGPTKCICNCLVCQGEEYKLEQESESESESEPEPESEPESEQNEDNIQMNSTLPEQICHYTQCKCKLKSDKAKTEFFAKYVKKIPNLIDYELKTEFVELADQLPKNDFHPNSNNQMIDLFHPSMYPYIKGKSIINSNSTTEYDPDMIFQWLPAEFKVSYTDDKTTTTINSYINNLTDSRLEIPIAKIFSKFVPHFNNLFNQLWSDNIIKQPIKLESCQVIVKAQEIVLDESKKSYPTGSWHLEGTSNEHIIATGIYYYDATNVKPNNLNFRVKVTEPEYVYYPQNCPNYVETHYGFIGDSYDLIPCIQLESVKTHEDLCLVFPNIMQHQVEQVNLIDPTLNGSRKILVFFLVDPNYRILSTADINPQQNIINESEAKTYRDILMFERKYESKIQDSVFERKWSLCEH